MIFKRLIVAAAIAGATLPVASLTAQAATSETLDIYRYVETSDTYLDQAEATLAADAQRAVDDYLADRPDASCEPVARKEGTVLYVHTGTDVNGVKQWKVSARFHTQCIRGTKASI